MAYSYDPNIDDPDLEEAAKSQLASGSLVGGGINTVPIASSQPTSPGAPTRSGTFANLNSYLDANAGNQFGGQFADKVNQDVNAATTAQQEGAAAFKAASDAGTVKSNPTSIANDLSNPTDTNSITDFQNQFNADYKGPSAYSDYSSGYQKAAGATQKAQDVTSAAQNEGGRFALLDTYFGNPNYNQGQKSLDNLLVQQDPVAQQGIAQAKENANKSLSAFQAQAPALADYAATNKAATDQAKLFAQQSIGIDPTTGTWSSDTTTPYAQAETALNNAVTNFNDPSNQAALLKTTIAPYQAQPYQPNQPFITDYGVDPSSFAAWTAADTQNISDPSQARINALETLASQPLTSWKNNATTPGYAFDKADFTSNVVGAANAYNKATNDLLNQYSSDLLTPGMDVNADIENKKSQLQALNRKYGQPDDANIASLTPWLRGL